MNADFQMDWMALSLGFAGQTVFLTIALLIMIKIQRFEWNFPGLVGSAALACALDHIPYVGIELSFAALLFCVTRLIKARTFTDTIFTVGVGYAITFAFNMFVLTALVGDLRPSARVRAREREDSPPLAVQMADKTKPAPAVTARVAPAVPVAPAKANVPAAPLTNASQALASRALPIPAVPAVDTNQVEKDRIAGEILKRYFVRGVSEGAINIALISDGTKNYDLAQGDTMRLDTPDGKSAAVKCTSVSEGVVVLNVEGQEVTLLRK
jgi:hypothetical protein